MTTVTSASAWKERAAKARQGILLTLPSGNVVRVRYVNPVDVLMDSRVPDSLTPIIMDIIDRNTQDANLREMFKAQDVLGRIVALNAIIEPRVVERDPADDEISVDDIEYEDRGYLLSLLSVSAAQLATFCEKQNRRMESLLSGEGDEQATE